MSKTIPVWLRVSVYLGASLGLLFLTWLAAYSETFSKIFPLSLGLSMILFMEAVAQPDPQEMVKTPLYRLIWKYPQRRDRLVAGISLLAMLVVYIVTVSWIGSWQIPLQFKLPLVFLCLALMFGTMAAIRYRFGSPEMRADITPKFLKRFLEKHSPDGQ